MGVWIIQVQNLEIRPELSSQKKVTRMKMIRAIIRPESVQKVIDALERNGINAMTRMNVLGRGKEMGITAGSVRYTEIPKEMLVIVVEDDQVRKTISTIETHARSGKENHRAGRIGDGKVFVTDVEGSYTIRTAE
jgi:nitrogen regulatory protein PII 1